MGIGNRWPVIGNRSTVNGDRKAAKRLRWKLGSPPIHHFHQPNLPITTARRLLSGRLVMVTQPVERMSRRPRSVRGHQLPRGARRPVCRGERSSGQAAGNACGRIAAASAGLGPASRSCQLTACTG